MEHFCNIKSIINMAHASFWGLSECAPKWSPNPTCLLIRVESRGTLMSHTMSSMTFCPCCFWVDSVAEGMGTAQAGWEGGGRRKSRGLWLEGLLRAGCLWQFSESVKTVYFRPNLLFHSYFSFIHQLLSASSVPHSQVSASWNWKSGVW